MQFLAPAAATALLAIPVILAFYILKVRGPEARVGTLMFWPRHLADRQANAPWKRLQFSWLLVVQLVVAAAMATALMRPGLENASAAATTTVVLLDGSPSMTATDVEPSRFGMAVQRARERAGQLSGDSQMAVVLLGEHAQLLVPATRDAGTVRAALKKARPGGRAANLEEGMSLANAILAGRPGGSVVLYSDGHYEPPTSPPPLSAPLTYESLGESRDNSAIESIGRTEEGDVFVRVANLGTVARELRLEMHADGRLVDIVPVTIAENSSVEPTWPRLPEGTAVLEARLVPGDDFTLDDRAWLVTAPQATRRVLVVSSGDTGFLTRALGWRPDLDVTVVKPADYKPESYDLWVFDRFVPPGPLPQPALVIDPPQGAGPVPAGPQVDPGGLLPANPREPILQYVSLRDVHVLSASTVQPPDGWRTVIAADKGPLLLVQEGGSRVAQLNFDIHRSDLPIRAGFPILVQNLVAHLLPSTSENQVLPLGQPVRLAADADTASLEVTKPDGARIRLGPPFPATLRDTLVPGVYSVDRRGGASAGVVSRMVVTLQDPAQSRIGPGEKPLVRATSRQAGTAPKGTLEIWPWMIGLALVAFLVESVVFLRG